MIIENFKMQDNVCKIEYDYEKNEVKTEGKSEVKFKFNITWWQVLIIVILVIILIYAHNRGRY